MMESMRWLVGLLTLVILILAGFGALYVAAGRSAPPVVTIAKPDRFVGQTGSVDVTAEAPNGKFTGLTIAVEQNGKTFPLFSLDAASAADVTEVDRNHLRINRPLGKASVPQLSQGPARIVVTATRSSFLNLRALTSTATRDFQVRLEAPRIAVVSTHHYVNHGGSEMVVYRATPADVDSGVRVGLVEYRGFPLTGAGVPPDVKVAFFALLHDQDLNARIVAFARDEAGNEARTTFVDNVFEKPFKRSKIELDDKFIERVVP
jgi:hypothetical protein